MFFSSLTTFLLTVLAVALTATAHAKNNIYITQKWCALGGFQLVIENPEKPQPMQKEPCATLTKDGMIAPTPIEFTRRTNGPAGNFVNYVLKNLLGRADITYRNFPFADKREFFVRSGTCKDVEIFVVEPALTTSDSTPCHFSDPVKITSDLPLTGVYLRLSNISLTDFVSELTQ